MPELYVGRPSRNAGWGINLQKTRKHSKEKHDVQQHVAMSDQPHSCLVALSDATQQGRTSTQLSDHEGSERWQHDQLTIWVMMVRYIRRLIPDPDVILRVSTNSGSAPRSRRATRSRAPHRPDKMLSARLQPHVSSQHHSVVFIFSSS